MDGLSREKVGRMRQVTFSGMASLLLAGGLVAMATPAAEAAPDFRAPFKCGQVWRASTYGGGAGTGHGPGEKAVDLNMYPHSAEVGQPILSSAAGTVTQSGNAGWGNSVRVDHGGGWATYYGHLSKISVARGAKVARGTQLGIVGSSGASAIHLHYDQRLNGSYQDVRFNGAAIRVGRVADQSAPALTSTNGCTSAFAKSPNPSIAGAPFVGSVLSASTGTWSPVPTFTYQWKRNGQAIGGATGRSYTVTPADVGSSLTVTVTAKKSGYTSVSRTSSGTTPVLMVDANGDGIDDSQQVLPWDSDLNGDGLADVVGFANAGIDVALNNGQGFDAPRLWLHDFGQDDGWRVDSHPRTLTDVNGDGRVDAVGFGNGGIFVALNASTEFAKPTSWSSEFGYSASAGGWRSQFHPRALADVNGDKRPDIVGFAGAGVVVALNTGKSFAKSTRWVADFGYDAGWRVESHPRSLLDVNGDGRLDVVGFGSAGVVVALNSGTGFSKPGAWSTQFGFGPNAGGWRVQSHPRTLVDVNADGLPDVVGFAGAGVDVALNNGRKFAPATRWSGSFGDSAAAGGWRVQLHPRVLSDVNADGRPDIVGFAQDGVQVALNGGTSFGRATRWHAGFGAGAEGWRIENHVRVVTDLNGDGRPDLAGFGNDGLGVAVNTGTGFKSAGLWSNRFGYHANSGGWRVQMHPRALSSAKVVRRTPQINGRARVGASLVGRPGAWRPTGLTFRYQWRRDGRPIRGATSGTYRVSSADLGSRLSIQVTGSIFGLSSASAVSGVTAKVQRGVFTSRRPVVRGKAVVGSRLTVKVKTWSPSARSYAYRWYRSGKPINGATKRWYKLTPKDKGRRISVRVTGARSGFVTKTVSSPATRRVR